MFQHAPWTQKLYRVRNKLFLLNSSRIKCLLATSRSIVLYRDSVRQIYKRGCRKWSRINVQVLVRKLSNREHSLIKFHHAGSLTGSDSSFALTSWRERAKTALLDCADQMITCFSIRDTDGNLRIPGNRLLNYLVLGLLIISQHGFNHPWSGKLTGNLTKIMG